MRPLELSLLAGRFAVCRLEPDAAIPPWALQGGFFSVTRTPDELSIVCEEVRVPQGVQHQPRWRVFKLRGPFAFSETGVLASLAAPLAETGISLFAVSTFDTDYILVSHDNVEGVVAALERAGHRILRSKQE